MCFWKRLNDYSCISKNNPDAGKICHYTNSADAVKGIITGCFWATDIRDFSANGEDVNEGYLILRQLRERISQLDGAGNVEIVNKLIGTEDAMHDYFNNHETYLISMSTNGDSEYMWQNRAGDNGYEIVLDKKKFIDS